MGYDGTMELLILILLLYFILKVVLPDKTLKKKQRKPPFKKRYDLDRRQPIDIFEGKMANAMLAEGKEVFVTAFCNNDEVLTVTATVGSRGSCCPSDNVHNWGEKANRIGATEIRQYHNHPPVFGRSFISSKDKKSNMFFHELLQQYNIRLRSFLVFSSRFGGYRIQEYN